MPGRPTGYVGNMTTAPNGHTTTNAGIPVASDEHSLTQGPGGGILLHDAYLIEKMAQFNRERVPERVVHAKGAGAFGEFTVTEDVSAWTKADFLQPGKKTEVLARFSSVAAEQGGADTQRDPRGFAVKFYTEQGNYDMVGNNTPVFFVKDPQKFQDFIRSQKRLPDSGLRSNDMQWDFWTLSPESAHQVTWLMGDRGLPRSWRTMNGYGSHTFQWINAAGEKVWVKYTFKTDQGNEFLTQAEGDELAGTSPDHHRQDLFGSIAKGDFPSWTMHVQIMPTADADGYRFNPFDLTKVWPHEDYPLIKVGTLTLNRNPENYFAQIEQATFEPSNFVPGIATSPDKMLLGRLFSYPDAHRYRVGPNYMQLPVNAPKATVNSYAKDGGMRYTWNDPGIPVYAPNSHGGPHADAETFDDGAGWSAGGDMVRSPYVQHAEDDDWGQAGTLVRETLDDAARERLIGNISGHLLNGVTEPVLLRAFEYWSNVDAELGKKVEEVVLLGADADAPTTGQSPTAPGDEAAKV
jgi:catalase